MKELNPFKYYCLLMLFISSVAFGAGKLKGTVSDEITNEVLIGANVILLGTSIGASANIEGEYNISAIPPGEYIVRCSFLGYVSKETKVTIIDDRTIEINFNLKLDVIEGEEVVITAQALGQAAAINQQLTSQTIVNVVSEQKIQELPDANAAEALGRLPGVSVTRSGGEANSIVLRGLNQKFTTVTVDGIKLSPTEADSRGIDLSTISQGSLSGIELFKAITADKDAEAIGGNVNFVTRTAPEERSLRLDSYGSYNKLDDDYGQYNFVFRYGERFFDNLLGVQVFGNAEQRNRSSESTNSPWFYKSGFTDYELDDFTVQYKPEERKRYGGKILLDYRISDQGFLKFNVELNNTDRKNSTISRNYPVRSPVINYNIRSQDINTDIFNTSLQGENHLLGWQANWSFSFVESNSDKPYDHEMRFIEPSAVDFETGEVISGMAVVPPNQRKGPFEVLIPYAANNFDLAYADRAKFRTSSNIDNEKAFFLNLKKDYNIWDMAGELKIGGKYRSKYHRANSSYAEALYYDGTDYSNFVKLDDGTVVPKDFAKYGFGDIRITGANQILFPNFLGSSPETRNIYDKYALNPLILEERLRAWYNLSINGYNDIKKQDEYDLNNAEDGQRYNLTENVTAGYLMNTLNIGDLATFISGVRIEIDNNEYNALFSPRVANEFTIFKDTSSTYTETNVLPNFHLILRPTDYMNIRVAAYKGIARPNFNLKLPTYIVGDQDQAGLQNFLKVGDSQLKNATAWNYEINTQFYSNTIGLLSVSAFYKEIKNEVKYLGGLNISGRTTIDSIGIKLYQDKLPFNTSTFNLYYPFNSDNPTRVWGFEFEHQANFRFLPGLLKNIVLDYNVSIVRTETYSPGEKIVLDTTLIGGFPIVKPREVPVEDKTVLENSPELFGNFAIGYDIAGFSARLSYFYQDQFYNSFSADNRSNRVQISFSRWDLSLKQVLTDNFTVGLNVNNISNTQEGEDLYNDETGWKLQNSTIRYGTTADLWLRVTL